MYKVMIVDDEASIRSGLKSVISWEDLGMEIVCEAENGKDALNKIEAFQPTVVLTDIRMPEMDGIELLKRISQQYPNIKVAVLSGYDDFDYVRTAMRLGAANYLLKPIDTEELIAAMREILENIGADVQEFLKYREFLQLLQKNTLNRVITGQIPLKELREKCDVLGISFQSSCMYLAAIQLNVQEEDHWKIYATLNICDELIHSPKDCYIFPDLRDNIILLFKDEPDTSRIQRLLEDCIYHIHKYLDTRCAAAFSGPASSHRELPNTYKDSLRLLNYQLLYGLDKVYSSIEYEIYKIGEAPAYEQLQYENILTLIKKGDKQAVRQYIGGLFSENRYINPETVKYSIVNIISYVLYHMEAYDISSIYLQKIKGAIYAKLQTVSYADQLKDLLIYFSDAIIGQLRSTSPHNYSFAVKKTIEYINEKYYDYNISLKTLGNALNINPAYLGRLFKLETNEFFSDYLNKKRVQKAKELLMTSGVKANEVAEKVGFSSISYFYTVFKKFTGQNPGDIRK